MGDPHEQGPAVGIYGNRRVYPLSAEPGLITIADIAHSLAKICRYGGRCHTFYSVAQHSVLVAHIVGGERPDLAMHGLLHDAAEAYLGDVVIPLKQHLRFVGPWGSLSFLEVESQLEKHIRGQLGLRELTAPEAAYVEAADREALAREAKGLMGGPDWAPNTEHEAITTGAAPEAAERSFLAAYDRLFSWLGEF